MWFLVNLLSIKWWNNLSDTEALEHVGIPSVYTLLQKAQAGLADHFVRIVKNWLSKKLYREIPRGKRSIGGKRNNTKNSSKQLNIDINGWELITLDRPIWQSKIIKGARGADVRRTTWIQKKVQAQGASASTVGPTHVCSICRGDSFRSRLASSARFEPTVIDHPPNLKSRSSSTPERQTTTTTALI